METIHYHTSLYHSTNPARSAAFVGDFDELTVNRLVNALFTVTVKPAGVPVFVDVEGREVYLYVSVDPCKTEAGKEALLVYQQEREKREKEARKLQEAQEDEIESLIAGMSREDLLARLRRSLK